MPADQRTRDQYEQAGRAVYAFLNGMPPIPSSLEGTPAGTTYGNTRGTAITAWHNIRDMWANGQWVEAANRMVELARQLQALQRTLERAEGMTGSALATWREWWRSSPVGIARDLFNRYMAGLDRIMQIGPAAAVGFGSGALLGLLLIGGFLYMASRK